MVHMNEDGDLSDGNGVVKKILPDGSTIWLKDAIFHRDNDLPAKILANGTKEWWENGKRHRSAKDKEGYTLPAIEHHTGTKEWFKDGQRHRDDLDEYGMTLPAIIGKTKLEVKRDGLIFFKFFDSKQWWKNGKLHRDDKATGEPIIDGNADFNLCFADFAKDFDDTFIKGKTLPAMIFFDKNRSFKLKLVWYKNGEKHRDDKIEHFVEKSLFHNGAPHVQSLTLPAVIEGNLRKEWWLNGSLHRDDKNEAGYFKYIEFVSRAKNNLKIAKQLIESSTTSTNKTSYTNVDGGLLDEHSPFVNQDFFLKDSSSATFSSLMSIVNKIPQESLRQLFSDFNAQDYTEAMIEELVDILANCGLFVKNEFLPTIETKETLEWLRAGKHHRDNDLPAVMRMADLSLRGNAWRQSIKQWYTNEKLGRLGGKPAVIIKEFAENASVTVYKQWLVDGKRHRIDGPCITQNDLPYEAKDFEIWCIDGVPMSKEEHPWWTSEQEKAIIEKQLFQLKLNKANDATESSNVNVKALIEHQNHGIQNDESHSQEWEAAEPVSQKKQKLKNSL